MVKGLVNIYSSVPSNASANGMHAWHAGSNAYLANQLGIVGAPLIFVGGVVHETPLDWKSFWAEQRFQGTVNHFLDSSMDIVANVFGMAVGYGMHGNTGVRLAIQWGNYIPGPGEPDPAFGGGGHYRGNPSDAWWQYP